MKKEYLIKIQYSTGKNEYGQEVIVKVTAIREGNTAKGAFKAMQKESISTELVLLDIHKI